MKKLLLILACLLLFPYWVSAKTTVDDMIGQMIVVGFHGTKTTDPEVKQIMKQIKKGQIGGVMILGYNIENPEQLKALVRALKSVQPKGRPLFVTVDQEGGAVQRLNKSNGFENFPSAKQVGQIQTPLQAYQTYSEMADMLKQYGINWNFGPDVDVDINPNCPIIGKKERSFSSNPQIVAVYAEQFVKAHREKGIFTTLKHFPGHGSAKSDTHLGVADVTDTWSEKELLPYIAIIKSGKAESIMPAHIFNKKIDDKNPASLSAKTVTGLLINVMGYKGLIITDDLQMGAIRNYYSLEDAVRKAVEAGNDVLLFSNYFKSDMKTPLQVRKTLRKAIRSGEISERRIENSYEKIMQVKRGLN